MYLNILMSMQLTIFNKTAIGVTLYLNAEISPLHVGWKSFTKTFKGDFQPEKIWKSVVAYIDIPAFFEKCKYNDP